MAAIENSLKYLFSNEGGYNNEPGDQPTNLGITQDTLAKWRGRPVSDDDVRRLNINEATRVYTFWYWNPLTLNACANQNVATAIFDMGVNMGISGCTKIVQLVLKREHPNLIIDGKLGQLTMQALNNATANSFISEFQKEIVKEYTQIADDHPEKRRFLTGWLNRSNKLLTLIEVQALNS